ncbi:hypothetical protein PHMEG_00018126 [Phytophthora megakarya]|uniref:Tc1-like transposase DDE domain-containing protein n=1 Tax=Phytophthora megakarya TaxID=4795 RepID=A0A225VXB8_9STRA|nr:hypothetical protein PHMEG_00018126 [Phytophthora megakarya]
MYADSEANIAFRNEYLKTKTANHAGTIVDRPEVYLDEAFCNANHVRGQTWLSSDNIRYNKNGKGDRVANRNVLLSLTKLNKPTAIYAANTIATRYKHTLYYTPPYHPTLQPIELIWGLVKNRIAADPPKSGADAVTKVLAGINAIKPQEWLNRFSHVQKIENDFILCSKS